MSLEENQDLADKSTNDDEQNNLDDEQNDDFAAAFNEPDEGEEYEEVPQDVDDNDQRLETIEANDEEDEEAVNDEQNSAETNAPEPIELDQVLAENKRLNHRLQSDSGRTAALQKKINDLEYAAEQRNDPKNIKVDSEAMMLLKEDYPDIADAIQGEISRGIAESTQRIDARVQESMAPMHQAEEQRLASIEAESLANAHRDYLDINDDPAYWNWVSQQSETRQKAAGSASSIDVIETLNLYKYSTGYAPKEDKSASLQNKRQKQIDDMRGVASTKGSGNRKTIAKDDYEGGFNS